jgi:hypothetical protein
MHQLIAIIAAAFGFLNGGHTAQPQDAIAGIGMAKPIPTATSTTRRPMDAIPPFPSAH